MSLLAAYCLSCILLGWVFVRLDVWPRTGAMLRDMASNLAVIRNERLSDLEKERALQAGSVRLLARVAVLTGALITTFAAAIMPVALGVWAQAFGWAEFVWFTLHPGVVAATLAACWLWSKLAHRRLGNHGA